MQPFDALSEQHRDAILKARKRVIEAIGKNMDLYGVTLSVGHLYGMLFFSEKPMTLDEMGREMEMSKTSMSTGVRMLLDLKMVNKVWEKGARKDLYEAESDWHQTFADYFAIEWRKAVEANVGALNKSAAELRRLKEQTDGEESLHAVLDRDLEKIEGALAYYRWLDRFIDTLESGRIYELVPKDEP
ncbi:GbsR/MarR family transcriptional regulator [Paenibacillus flagellatus]|uniref:HTH-type transcriptional regulator n=1 Tax=Paenibacillus flagellatus TaxID=2211139 RepID=A0A2V5L176_9BACL|nr:GbsR/MarR family transcriptional regulator [Paenibacillus flagellatus]PYI56446.1 GbsR/MarR family transcriptional regulator [Paenibacillus flagellatus]